MPGGNPPPKPSFSDHRKPRWESSASTSAAPKSKPSPNPTPQNNNKTPAQESKPKPRPQPNPSPRPQNSISVPGPRTVYPIPEPPPPAPSYGFHMLERRCMVLADGSVRSYFALPLDYENFKPIPQPDYRPEFPGPRFERPHFAISPEIMGQDPRQQRNPEYWNSWKRKLGEGERGDGKDDGLERQRQQLLQYGNASGPGSSVGYGSGRSEEMRASKIMRIHEGSMSSKLRHNEVDQSALNKAFLHLVKLVFETVNQKKSYLTDGKQGPLPCLACNRSSKNFPDAHSLVMHAYNIESTDSVVDHLAFHKALCVLMGWNYLMPPDNSKAYQNLSAHEAEANQDDLIMWPPSVLILNTTTGKGKEGRMEGLGNRAMDAILKDLGFTSGKSMSMYSREGHTGIHVVKFSMDESGLKDALRMADYFEREKHGRKAWTQVQSSTHGKDDESNPNLMKLDPKTGEKKSVFYGHLATVADLDKVTFEIKKKVSIVSRKAYRESK